MEISNLWFIISVLVHTLVSWSDGDASLGLELVAI